MKTVITGTIHGVHIEGKMVPTIKLSDDPGKHTGPEDEVDLCKKVLNIQNDQITIGDIKWTV